MTRNRPECDRSRPAVRPRAAVGYPVLHEGSRDGGQAAKEPVVDEATSARVRECAGYSERAWTCARTQPIRQCSAA